MSRLITMLEDLSEDLEGNELMSDDDMLANEESLTVQLDELSSSFEDLDEVDSLSAEMESYISTGNRLEAVQCSAKIQLVIKRLSDRHGIEYHSESLSLESLSDATWLEYQQESNSNLIFSVFVKIIGWVVGIVILILVLVNNAVGRGSSGKGEWPEAELSMSYKPQINLENGKVYTMTELVEARTKFFARVVPHMSKHMQVIADMMCGTITDLSEALNAYDKNDIGVFTRVMQKWQNEYAHAGKKAADAISPVDGIHVNNLFIFSNNTARGRIAGNKYVKEYMEANVILSLETDVKKDFIHFSPYVIGHYKHGAAPKTEHITSKNVSNYGGEKEVRNLLHIENSLATRSPIKHMGKTFELVSRELSNLHHRFQATAAKPMGRFDRESFNSLKQGCQILHETVEGVPHVFRLLHSAVMPCILDHNATHVVTQRYD